MLDDDRSEFLTKIVDILARLHETSVQRGEPLLASLIAIAKGEAEETSPPREQACGTDGAPRQDDE